MIFEFTNYRSYLRSVLTGRMEKNRAYTMRAFALQLGIAPSMLTSIFQFKRNLSQLKAYQVARKLGLSEQEAEYFSLLVQLDATKSPEHRTSLVSKIQAINPSQPTHLLDVDRFQLIAQWYHLPILDMTEITGFKLTPKNAATKLGISLHEAELAIERLERLELLSLTDQGYYVKVKDSLLVASEIPNEGLRLFYAQMLQKGIESLATQSSEERYMSSLTIAFDPDQMPEVRKLISTCRSKIEELALKSTKRSKIYHLGTTFFDLTHAADKKQKGLSE